MTFDSNKCRSSPAATKYASNPFNYYLFWLYLTYGTNTTTLSAVSISQLNTG